MAECPHCGGQVHCPSPRNVNQEQCPNCREYMIVPLPSMNIKLCFNCQWEFDWKLKPNQKSVLIHGLIGEDE